MNQNHYFLAWKNCKNSTYPKKMKRMGAVVVRGGAILSVEANHKGKCAERRAIRPHVDYRGATVYVARINNLVSRPCPRCMVVLKKAGIKSVIYINITGNMTKEYL